MEDTRDRITAALMAGPAGPLLERIGSAADQVGQSIRQGPLGPLIDKIEPGMEQFQSSLSNSPAGQFFAPFFNPFGRRLRKKSFLDPGEPPQPWQQPPQMPPQGQGY